MSTPENISAGEQYATLAEGLRAVYVAENLLREFVRVVLTDTGADIGRECQKAINPRSGQRSTPPAALMEQGPLEMSTFGELGNIISNNRSPFAARLMNLSYEDFRSLVGMARTTRNAVAHLWPLSHDAIPGVRELSRWLIKFLSDMNATSPRIEDLVQMFREQARDDHETVRRRSLTCAAYGVPYQSVVNGVAEHLAHPDPEGAAVMELPAALAFALDLRAEFRFSQSATNSFRSALEVIRSHALDHDSRPGEEGADVARLIVRDHFKGAHEDGRLVHTDVDYPAFQHAAQTVWNKSNIAVVNLSGLIFEDEGTGPTPRLTETIIERLLEEIRRARTAAVVMPHVCWINGARLDVRSICRAIRDTCPLVTTIVDGAQAVGHIPLEVEQYSEENEDIDFYIGCGHKWLRGPESVGFVRVGRRYNSEAECPSCMNYLAAGDLLTQAGDQSAGHHSERSGTKQWGLAMGLHSALRPLTGKKAERNALYARVRRNADALREIVKRFQCLVLLDPPEKMKTSIVSFTTREQQPAGMSALQEALRAEQFFCVAYRLPHYLELMRGPGFFLRLSPSPDLTERDFQQIEEVFHRTLP